LSVLSAAGVPRALLHAAGQAGALSAQQAGGLEPEVVDEALGRLAGSSLRTFSTGGGTVTAHRLVMRVTRERLARQGHDGHEIQAHRLLRSDVVEEHLVMTVRAHARRDLAQILRMAWPEAENHRHSVIQAEGPVPWFIPGR
jgi:hypothetical protein